MNTVKANNDINSWEEDKELLKFKKNANKFNKAIIKNPEMIGRVLVTMLVKIYANENDIIDCKGLNEELIYLIKQIESK